MNVGKFEREVEYLDPGLPVGPPAKAEPSKVELEPAEAEAVLAEV